MPNLLLMISGSIAAYKSANLCRLLQKKGFAVRIIITEAACDIMPQLTLKSVCKSDVYLNTQQSTDTSPMLHIDLARWADILLVAPASAHTLARLAYGISDDLMCASYLATKAAVFIAPAMNQTMWQHAATRAQMKLLHERKHIILGPAIGDMACGEYGEGPMLDENDIIQAIFEYSKNHALNDKENNTATDIQPLRGMRILINAGPTREAIDCMRYLSNRSSGRMGYALAASAKRLGARVCLISGPTALPVPTEIDEYIQVQTAAEMLKHCLEKAAAHDAFIACAAVSDFRPEHFEDKKIEKDNCQQLTLTLIKNPDIVKTIAERFPELRCIGFAAQSDHLIEKASAKMNDKKLHAMIANDTSKGASAEQTSAAVSIIRNNKKTVHLPMMHKSLLSLEIINILFDIPDQHDIKNKTSHHHHTEKA